MRQVSAFTHWPSIPASSVNGREWGQRGRGKWVLTAHSGFCPAQGRSDTLLQPCVHMGREFSISSDLSLLSPEFFQEPFLASSNEN